MAQILRVLVKSKVVGPKYLSRNFVWFPLFFGSFSMYEALTSVKVLILGFQPAYVVVGMRNYVEVGVTLLDRMAGLKPNEHNIINI